MKIMKLEIILEEGKDTCVEKWQVKTFIESENTIHVVTGKTIKEALIKLMDKINVLSTL
jgi:hypothetical protein